VLSSTVATGTDLHVEAGDCSRLLELLSLVPDPRCARGIRHSVAGLLAVATAAVLAGANSVLAIGEWAGEAPQGVLAGLGARFSHGRSRFIAAHTDTFRRVLRAVNAAAVDTAIGLFLAERAEAADLFGEPERVEAEGAGIGEQPGAEQVEEADEQPVVGALAVDGKAARGARQPDGRAVHLFSAMLHRASVVVAQRDVHHKTNEITQLKPLLDPLNLRGWAVTLDALHAQRETARYLVEDKHASYVFTAVKDNQPTLFTQLDALPWQQTPIGYRSEDRGHGRLERRTIRVLPAPEGIFPYARQAFLVERYVYHPHDGRLVSAAAALSITCLSAKQAGPSELAGFVRDHWGIESLHWIRDVTFDEDRHQLRQGSGPQVLAGLRNLAIGALRTSGRNKIASSLRWVSRNPVRVLNILGQPA
jgi:predicted transposase YbfD/YdcC